MKPTSRPSIMTPDGMFEEMQNEMDPKTYEKEYPG